MTNTEHPYRDRADAMRDEAKKAQQTVYSKVERNPTTPPGLTGWQQNTASRNLSPSEQIKMADELRSTRKANVSKGTVG